MRGLRIGLLGYRGNMRCGGQGIYLWNLARSLVELGHEVEIWSGPPYPDPMPFANRVHRVTGHEFWAKWFVGEARGFLPRPVRRTFTPFGFYELGSSWLGFLPEPALFSLRVFRELGPRVREFDLIHDVQSLGYGLLGLRKLGPPVVSTVHHPLSVDRRASFARDRDLREAIGTAKFYPVGMQSAVARRLDHILTSSEASRRALVSDFGVDPQRITNVWNGVDTETFSPDTKPRAANTVLCVARAGDPNKGVRDLIDALGALPGVRLLLIDDPGPSNPARIWAKKARCLERVEIVGGLGTAELVEAYRRASLVVVPSHYEGFGLPAAEAMACGTAVVVSDGGALPEVVSPTCGRIVPARRPQALARAIAELLEKPALRAQLGMAGRDWACERFGWPAIAGRTEGLYRELLDRLGRPTSRKTSAKLGTRVAMRSPTSSTAAAVRRARRSSHAT